MAILDAEPYPLDLIAGQAGLVIIDMQRDFLEPGGFGAVLGNDVGLLAPVVPVLEQLLAACRRCEMTVIHTKECHRGDLSDCPVSKRRRGRGSLTIGDRGPMGR